MIDWDRLLTLRSDIGEDDFADVAFLFVAEIEETLARLVSDPAGARAADFHFLRGSAANLGFIAMADACIHAEQACHGALTPDVAGLAEIFRMSLAETAPHMPELGQAA